MISKVSCDMVQILELGAAAVKSPAHGGGEEPTPLLHAIESNRLSWPLTYASFSRCNRRVEVHESQSFADDCSL